METATFGAGCFWGVEEAFRSLDGVVSTRVGYLGGTIENPTYEDVCSGRTGHAEVVRIEYDPGFVSYEALLDLFWKIHDPTQRDRQGPDVGRQYRSAIFFSTPAQEAAAIASRDALDASGAHRGPIVTEITAASAFHEAEEYHQQYLAKRGRNEPRAAAPAVNVTQAILRAVIVGPMLVAGGGCAMDGPITRPTTAPTVTASDEYVETIEQWHAQRLERLRAEDGWLTLVGLHWLDERPAVIGRAPSSDIVYVGFPVDRVGTIAVKGGAVTFAPAPGVEIEGLPGDGRLTDDADGAPTVLRTGSCRMHVLRRGDRFALRVRDAQAPLRLGFTGVDRFPVDPGWRLAARFVPQADEGTVEFTSVVGTVTEEPVAGRAEFVRGGVRCSMVLLPGPDERRYFVVFGDASNGSETYGGGRFLVAERSEDGRTVSLDFNRAYNPPCSFTHFATCPLPPACNRLPFAVTAGEKASSR